MQDAGWTARARRGVKDARNQRRGMSLLILAAVTVAMILVASARAAVPTESVVRINPTAVVTSDTVTLNDIAVLNGDDARLAGTWAITASPAPGKEVVVDSDAIQQVLVRRGINASNWIIRGSTKCRISRPMRLVSADSAETRDKTDDVRKSRRSRRLSDVTPMSAPAAATAISASQPAAPDANTLEGIIHQQVAARIAKLGGRPVVQVSPGQQRLMRLSRPAYEFQVLFRGERMIGMVPMEITIYRDGKVDQVHSILTDVSLAKTVVVATGPINRGQTIRSEDVTLREQKFDRVDRIGVSDLKAVVGQRAVRFITKNEMLVGKDIEPVPFIVRNDLVTVTIKRGNVSIKGVAKAMSSKSYGEMVELRNESSKETYMAVVTGIKTAELVVTPASQTPAQTKAVSLMKGRN